MPRVRLTIEDADAPGGWREVEARNPYLACRELLPLLDPLQLQEIKVRDIEQVQMVLRRLARVVPVTVYPGAA